MMSRQPPQFAQIAGGQVRGAVLQTTREKGGAALHRPFGRLERTDAVGTVPSFPTTQSTLTLQEATRQLECCTLRH